LNFAVFLVLIFAALLFVEIGQPLPAALAAIAALLILAFKTGKKGAHITKKTAKILAQDVGKQVEESEGSHPGLEVAERGFKNAGELTGQQMFSSDKKVFKYKGIGSVNNALENVVKTFNKLFK
jgi:hypothetical protein